MPTTKGKKGLKAQEITSEYWHKLIHNPPLQTRLWLDGFDIPLDEKQINHDKYLTLKIPLKKPLITKLEKFIKKQKFSIETIMHGVFGLLLSRFSSCDDVIYGATQFIDKKHHRIAYPILPMRVALHEEDTLLCYFKSIHEELKNNSFNKSTYTKVTEENPEFKNLFSYIFVTDHVTEKKTASVDFDVHAYPLALVLHNEEILKLCFYYSEEKFNHASIENLAKHFLVVLDRIIQDPEQLVTHYSILTEEESKEILLTWNNKQPKKTTALTLECVHDIFHRQLKQNPHQPVVIHNDKSITYSELDHRANQVANLLLSKQINPGDVVAVFMDRTPAMFAAMLGIFKVGAIFVPLNPKYPDDRISYILEDANTHLILVTNTDRIPENYLDKTIILDERYEAIEKFENIAPNLKLDVANLIAYVIYTSGTTGQPKGVMIKHISLVNLANWYVTCFGINERDRVSQFASQGFDTFFCEVIPAIGVGASIYIIDDHEKLNPTLFMDWMVRNKITITDLPTSYAQIILNAHWPDDASLRLMKIGGESMLQYPAKMYPFDIWNIYGPTEATVESIFMKIFSAHIEPENQPCKHLPPPIGKPLANSEAYVVDQHLEPVPVGVVGELLIGGINISPGYLNRHQLNREKFIRNIFNEDPNSKLYRTGDLVRWLSDGNLEFVGRVDHQVKIRGYRIELSEIETAISQHPDISEVVVLAKELVNGQKTLISYLVPNLDKLRIPYQERCLLEGDDNQYIQALTEDISKEGIAVSSFSERLTEGHPIRINVQLPGMSNSRWISGNVVWQTEQRAGIKIDNTPEQMSLLAKSVEYYLTTHNLMDTLQSASSKRNIRKALKKKLPEYMIPSVFSILPQFPLTINGKVDVKALPPPKDFERLLDRKYVEPRNKTEKKLAKIWSDILLQTPISITDSFFDLGGTSLQVSQLSVKILQDFNISIPIKIFFDLPFIPVIAEYIDSKGKSYNTKSSAQVEINLDAVLAEDILPPTNISPNLTQPKGILLTGGGGFLGIYLLRELLKSTTAKIYCLIRKGEFESVAKRLISTVSNFGLENEISLSDRRIVIIASDIGLHQFGIPKELYDNIADKVDLIYHCGAQVNTMASYSNLRTSNVLGTLEVIKFATYKIGKAIHYISTLSSAYKKDEDGNYSEEFPDADSSHLIGGYALSKWVSERLLTQLKNRGLPVTIYRSGYILGQTDTGATSLNDALLLLIKGCIQMGTAPNWNEKITILPVDDVSKAIIALSLHQNMKSNVFHLDHPIGIMWNDLIAWLIDFGYEIRCVSHQEWLQELMKIDETNALFPFLPAYLSQLDPPETPETGMEHTLSVLHKLNIQYTPIDDKLLDTYVTYFIEKGFFPATNNWERSTNTIRQS